MDSDIAAFNKQLEAFKELTEQAITKTFRDIVVEVGAAVIKFSPVLTGRFKGNWQMTVGAPSTHSLNTYDEEGSATLAKIKAAAQTLNAGQIAYIVNNLTYALNVEVKGWKATPAYMPVQRSLAEFDALVAETIARHKVDK